MGEMTDLVGQLSETAPTGADLFFGLDHAGTAVSHWTAGYDAACPRSALGYQIPAAYAAHLPAKTR